MTITIESPDGGVRVVVRRLSDGWVRTAWIPPNFPLLQDTVPITMSPDRAALWAMQGMHRAMRAASEAAS